MTARLSSARVAEILAMDDQPVLRNLLVTHGYHQLTHAMKQLFGEPDYLWPIFAAWASRQAGEFISQEFLPRRLRALLDDPSAAPTKVRDLCEALPADEPTLLDTADAIADGVSTFIAGGNTIVFEELGHAFARFDECFADPAARTAETLAALVGEFSEGPSEPDRVRVLPSGRLEREAVGGQTLIREAMAHYLEALHETAEDARAELIFLANAKCGLHEQIRLQPYIAGALDAPTTELLCLGGRSEPRAHAETLAAIVRRFVTELAMTLELPGQTLRLGGDLPAPKGQPMWPKPLETLETPALVEISVELGAYETREANLSLLDRIEGFVNELLGRLDLAAPEAQGTAAKDWTVLADRMRYIFAYFRSRQRDASLLVAPLDQDVIDAIMAGQLPAGLGRSTLR